MPPSADLLPRPDPSGPASAFGTFEATVETLERLCARYERPRVLDIGCGDGRHLRALAPRIGAGVGIDISPEAVAAATRRAAGVPHLVFRRLEAERVDDGLGEGTPVTFDLVCFVGSLEHIADPEAALAAARRRMRAASRVVVVAIAPRAPHAVLSRHALRFTATPVVGHLGVDGVGGIAERAGLSVESVQPLRRGTRRRHWLRRLLPLYDCLGGETQAVVLSKRRT